MLRLGDLDRAFNALYRYRIGRRYRHVCEPGFSRPAFKKPCAVTFILVTSVHQQAACSAFVAGESNVDKLQKTSQNHQFRGAETHCFQCCGEPLNCCDLIPLLLLGVRIIRPPMSLRGRGNQASEAPYAKTNTRLQDERSGNACAVFPHVSHAGCEASHLSFRHEFCGGARVPLRKLRARGCC